MFQPVSSKLDVNQMENAVLQFWKEYDIFHQSMQLRAGQSGICFYEGPPTANGKPGVHHVGRALKIFSHATRMRGTMSAAGVVGIHTAYR